MAARFLGAQYPLLKGARGLMAQKSGVDQIKADMLQLLLTNPGERCMLPTYGTPLRKLMFEPNDASLTVQARQMIANSISQWEPRVVITNIEVVAGIDSESLNPMDNMQEREAILGIKISFVDPQNINQVESLMLEVPIGV